MKLTWTMIAAGALAAASSLAAEAQLEAHDHAHMHSHPAASQPEAGGFDSVFPTPENAKNALNTTSRHREWVRVEMGSKMLFAFVVYPDRSNPAPAVLINDRHGATDWSRSVADQLAAAGFLAVVPDVLTGEGPNGGAFNSFGSAQEADRALNKLGPDEIARRNAAVLGYATSLPIANGKNLQLDLDRDVSRIDVLADSAKKTGRSVAQFALDEAHWSGMLKFLAQQTDDHPVFAAANDEHAAHYAMLAQARGNVPGADNTSYAQKRPDLPAGYYTAEAALANSKLRKEWIKLDVGGVQVRTFIVYPAGEGKAGTVIVMQHGVGMDTWVQGVADQLAQSGFIAIAPDIWSGTGPDGGGLDSSRFLDDAMIAGRNITQDEGIRRYRAARDYALQLERSNGKSASLGFCMGGGYSFRFAGEVPELNAAVVFYGTPPDEAIMARINAPILGLFGENDERVVAAVEPAVAAMKRLGKTYEPHIYPKATHSFVLFQEVAGNPAAINDAWPRAIAFLRKQLQ